VRGEAFAELQLFLPQRQHEVRQKCLTYGVRKPRLQPSRLAEPSTAGKFLFDNFLGRIFNKGTSLASAKIDVGVPHRFLILRESSMHKFCLTSALSLLALCLAASSTSARDLAAGNINAEDGGTKARGTVKLDYVLKTKKLNMPISLNLSQTGKGTTGKASLAIVVMDKNYKKLYNYSKELSVAAKPNGTEQFKDHAEEIAIPEKVAAELLKEAKFVAFKVAVGQEARLPENAKDWKKEIETWDDETAKIQKLKSADYHSAGGWDFIRMSSAK
jgi:hypothetical protein